MTTVIHTFRLPSAVSLSRLQPPQKFSLIDVMKPIWPTAPATFQALSHTMHKTDTATTRVLAEFEKLRQFAAVFAGQVDTAYYHN